MILAVGPQSRGFLCPPSRMQTVHATALRTLALCSFVKIPTPSTQVYPASPDVIHVFVICSVETFRSRFRNGTLHRIGIDLPKHLEDDAEEVRRCFMYRSQLC